MTLTMEPRPVVSKTGGGQLYAEWMNPWPPQPQPQPQPPPWPPPPWPPHTGETSAPAPQQPPAGRQRRRQRWPVGLVAVAGLAGIIVGGFAGSLMTGSRAESTTTAAAPATVPAAVPSSAPDPVCAEWAPIANSAAARQRDWAKTDPKVPGSEWSAEQKALTANVIPVMQQNVEDLRRLAAKAADPFLADLMRAQAAYEAAFVAQLGPTTYDFSDHALWQANINFSGAVLSACTTVAPR